MDDQYSLELLDLEVMDEAIVSVQSNYETPTSSQVQNIPRRRVPQGRKMNFMGEPAADLPGASVAIGRKVPFRWCSKKDLCLVKEVEKELPFDCETKMQHQRWLTIARAMNDNFKGAGLNQIGARRRFERIMESFRKEDLKSRYKSGEEEHVGELEEKLGLLLELQESAEAAAKERKVVKEKKLGDAKSVGEQIRGAALDGMKRKAENDGGSEGRNRKSLTEVYMIKTDSEAENRRRHLDIKAKDLELRNRMFEHQRESDLKDQKLKQEQFLLQKMKDEAELKRKEDESRILNEERNTAVATQKLMLELLMKNFDTGAGKPK